MKQKIISLQMLLLGLVLTLGMYAQPTFTNKLPIPPLVNIPANGTIELEMRPGFHKFNPSATNNVLNGYPSSQSNGISTFCYNLKDSSNMSILGPTLKWHSGDSININVHNMLGGDTTTTHWHGAEVAAIYDGGPHQSILPDSTWKTHFRILDNAATLWYHPHLHNETASQVQLGLSGMIIVEQPTDTIRAKLPQSYGIDDIPIILGDIGFKTDTTGGTTKSVIETAKGKRPYNIVNGVNSPYLDVPGHFVRFRILNGSTRKGIIFGFRASQDSLSPADSLISFRQVGTDGGYTLSTNTRKSMMNGPGSREEIIIDLSNYLGQSLYLVNLKKMLPSYVVGSALTPPGTGGGGKDTTSGKAFLKLNVVSDNNFVAYTPVTSFSNYTKSWESDLADSTGAYHRPAKKLELMVGAPNAFVIDGTPYEMMRIDDIVCENTKEIWTIQNPSPIAHPFHIHKIQFRILSVVDSTNHALNLDSLGFNGPKDDVLMHPGWTLKFLGNFYDYGYDGPDTDTAMMLMNTYMYHCHILTHEDALGGGMMHQFVVKKNPCTPSVSSTSHAMMTHNMTLFPNPSSGELYLRGQSERVSTVVIFDAMGRVLKEQSLPPFYSDMRINTDNLPKGFLFVTWKTEHGMITRKFFLDK